MATKFRPRPIASVKYQARLPRLGPKHAVDWDCGDSTCKRCEPFRKIEKLYWDSLSEDEKHEVLFFRWDV